MGKTTQPTQCYSHDEEIFNTDISTIYSEIQSEYEIGDEITILVAMTQPQKHSDFVRVDDLIEQAQERAHSFAPDFSDDYLEGIAKENRQELEKIVTDWLNKNVEQPEFWGIGPTKIYLEGYWDGEEISQKTHCTDCEESHFEKELTSGLCRECADEREN